MKLRLLTLWASLLAAIAFTAGAEELVATVTNSDLTGHEPFVEFTLSGSDVVYNGVSADYTVNIDLDGEPYTSFTGMDDGFGSVYVRKSGTSYLYYVYLANPLVFNGVYTFHISEGALYSRLDGTRSPAFSFDTTVTTGSDPTEVAFTPQPGAYHRSKGFNKLTLTFPGQTIESINDETVVVNQVDGRVTNVDKSKMSIEGISLIITGFVVQRVGDYIISIPENLVTLKNKQTGAVTGNPPYVLNYTINDNITWTITPEPDSELADLQTVSFHFDKPISLGTEAATGTTPFGSPTNRVSSEILSRCGIDTDFQGVFSLSDDNMTLNLTFTPAFNLGGIFAVKLYAGDSQLIINDGEEFNGIVATYKLQGDVPCYSPQSKGTLPSITETKVMLPYSPDGTEATSSFKAYYTNGSETVDALYAGSFTYNMDTHTHFTVIPKETIYTPGDWKLVVEEGSVLIKNFDMTMPASKLEVSLKVEGGYSEEVLPQEGSKIDNFSDFKVVFSHVNSISLAKDKSAYVVVTHRGEFSIEEDLRYALSATVKQEGSEAEVALFPADEMDLMQQVAELPQQNIYTYKLSIPEGVVIVNDVAWAGGDYVYDFEMPEEHNFSFSPASGSTLTEPLETIKITVDNAYGITVAKSETDVTEGGEKVAVAKLAADSGFWTLTISPKLDKNGTFAISLYGMFIADGEAIELEGLTYTLDIDNAVDSLLGEETVTVFSIDGRQLLRDADASALRSLAPGLYIVNGKKLLLTKASS